MTRFNEVTEKLNKMFNGSEEQKDKLVYDLKAWLKRCATLVVEPDISALNEKAR